MTDTDTFPRTHTHILIVEDDRAIAALIADALQDEIGGTTTVLHDGSEAIAFLRQHPVHLAILDYQLPGADGLAVYDAMRAQPHAHGTPVLFVTANTEGRVFRQRTLPHLRKPFALDDLFAAVSGALAPQTARIAAAS